jgi:hypothetical protein
MKSPLNVFEQQVQNFRHLIDQAHEAVLAKLHSFAQQRYRLPSMVGGPWANFALRLLLLPLVALIDVLQLPWSIVLVDEPSASNEWGARASLRTAQTSGEARDAAIIGCGTWPQLAGRAALTACAVPFHAYYGMIRDLPDAALETLSRSTCHGDSSSCPHGSGHLDVC